MDPVTISLIVLSVWLASALILLGWRISESTIVDREHVIMASLFGPVSFLIIAYFAAEDFAVPRWRRLVRYAGRVKTWLSEFPR